MSYLKRTSIVLLFCLCGLSVCWAQDVPSNPDPAPPVRSDFRIESTPIKGGAEIITIFARTAVFADVPTPTSQEIPLFSVLRDTLGDNKPENDQLRYVWLMTHAEPTLMQKAAGFVPFLYSRTTNNLNVGSKPPPAFADLRRSNRALWSQIMWMAFRRIVVSEFGAGPMSGVAQYRQNAQDYRRSAVASALTLLSAYQNVEGEKILSDAEMMDIQARLRLSEKPLGWHVQDEYLHRVYEKETAGERDTRGHNWELLRQYAERQGLYFDPLEMPDGTATHAMLWVDSADLETNRGRKFESRFLNIKNPWTDEKLRNWTGYTETVWFDNENRVVPADTAGATPRRMIPIALYGLDHPHIPIILVDFRDAGNPHRREITRRVLTDVTANVLVLSGFGNIPYFLSHFVYEFVTGRRGMDVNQPSRMRSYAQLKTLLALDQSLDTGFRDELAKRIERVATNPFENDLQVELSLAQTQYKNLIDYATRPDGLPARLDRDRREEMVRVAHSRKEQFLIRTAHYLTLGLYTHREDGGSELMAQMDVRRQLEFHERFLRETAFKSADPNIDTDLAKLKRSLNFVAANGTEAMDKTARALGKIFAVSQDEDLRTLCLAGLYRINNSTAKNQLLAIYDNKTLTDNWRVMSARYLRRALDEGQRISKADAVQIAGIAFN